MNDHAGKMFKVCPNGHRSDLSQAICVQCNADLNNIAPSYEAPERPFAPESESESATRIESNRDTESFYCDCPSPVVSEGAKICAACDGVVRPKGPEPASPEPDPEGERCPTVFLELPGGSRVRLGSEGVVVGRDPTAVGTPIVEALRPYRGVSGRHLCLALDGDTVILIDLGSRNGTWIRMQKLGSYTPHRIPVADLSCPVWLGEKAVVNLIKE